MTESSTTGAAERFRQTLEEMADLVGDRGHHDNPRRWNRLLDEWRADRHVLAETDEGRATMTALMADPGRRSGCGRPRRCCSGIPRVPAPC